MSPEAPSPPAVAGFEHRVASHCETGSLRNLLAHAGLEVSEPMVFGLGSGPAFYYLFFARGPSTFPLIGIRNKPGGIMRDVGRLTGIDVRLEQASTTARAVEAANEMIARGTPVAASLEMFRMRYLPAFMRVHAPFHFVVLLGREGDLYTVSDPYHATLARLHRDDLEAAWATHAPLARDNLMCHVRSVPAEVDWKAAARRAMARTCRAMVLPPVVSKVFAFVGIEGMRTYARAIRRWTERYRGVRLREGILYNAVAFEDQGTGGAAFRLIYGAFLQEAAELFGSAELSDIAERFVVHGRRWRACSRKLVVAARPIPMVDVEYEEWRSGQGRELEERLDEIAREVEGFAETEAALFRELLAATGRLA